MENTELQQSRTEASTLTLKHSVHDECVFCCDKQLESHMTSPTLDVSKQFIGDATAFGHDGKWHVTQLIQECQPARPVTERIITYERLTEVET